MTTTVKVQAHCASSKEVVVEVWDGSRQVSVLQDGESDEKYAYDARKITVYEREKKSISEEEEPSRAFVEDMERIAQAEFDISATIRRFEQKTGCEVAEVVIVEGETKAVKLVVVRETRHPMDRDQSTD